MKSIQRWSVRQVARNSQTHVCFFQLLHNDIIDIISLKIEEGGMLSIEFVWSSNCERTLFDSKKAIAYRFKRVVPVLSSRVGVDLTYYYHQLVPPNNTRSYCFIRIISTWTRAIFPTTRTFMANIPPSPTLSSQTNNPQATHPQNPPSPNVSNTSTSSPGS